MHINDDFAKNSKMQNKPYIKPGSNCQSCDAREKRRLRLAESQRSDVLSAWERERVRLRCVQCNHVITDSDWSQFKSEGWDVEIVTQCISCIDAMIEHDLASTSSLT